MKESEFVSYVGPSELHDGSVLRLERTEHCLAVFVRGYDGSVWELTFSGVAEVMAKNAENMVLYAVAEFVAVASLRRFIFVNWNEESDAFLQVVAQELQVGESS